MQNAAFRRLVDSFKNGLGHLIKCANDCSICRSSVDVSIKYKI